MKFWPVISGVALVVALAGCSAEKTKEAPTPVQADITQPSVSGSIYIRQRIALPAEAVLTVTLSDATRANAPSKVLSQRVVRTGGKQAPFHFSLPFNPTDIQPEARILLSAAIMIDGHMAFITQDVQPVINGGKRRADLVLVPVPSVALQTQPQLPSATPTSSVPASSQY